MVRRGFTAATVIALALLAPLTGCGSGNLDHGEVFRPTAAGGSAVAVDAGEVFSLALDQNASIGDNWSLRTAPDAGIATATGEEYVAGGGGAGGGGTRYFVFRAERAGRTTLTLFNCYRCDRTPETADSRAHSRTVTVDLTVR